jgi:hypothetical protein
MLALSLFHPLIERLYTIIRRRTEGGLKGRFWFEINIWNHFHLEEEFPEDSSDICYFPLVCSIWYIDIKTFSVSSYLFVKLFLKCVAGN